VCAHLGFTGVLKLDNESITGNDAGFKIQKMWLMLNPSLHITSLPETGHIQFAFSEYGT